MKHLLFWALGLVLTTLVFETVLAQRGFLAGFIVGSLLSKGRRRYGGYRRRGYRGGYRRRGYGYGYKRRGYYGKREAVEDDEDRVKIEVVKDGGVGTGEDLDAMEMAQKFLLQASVEDADDCLKRFVCELNTRPLESLSEVEKIINDSFGPVDDDEMLDVTSASVEFDLAAKVGATAGMAKCQMIYARCATPYDETLQALTSQFDAVAQPMMIN